MSTDKRAFTLAELVVMVLILAVFAAVAVPRFNYSAVRRNKADCTARKLVSVLRRARMLAVSNAAANTVGFSVAMAGSSPYNSYHLVDLDTGGTVEAYDMDSAVTCTGGDDFMFSPTGALKAGSDSQLVVSSSGRTYTINVVSATGMVTCTEN